MNKIKAPKLIFIVFLLAVIYVIIYEFNLINPYPYNSIHFIISRIFSLIAYSIISATLFYYISIYLPFYIPEKKKTIKILLVINENIEIINTIIYNLQFKLKVQNENYFVGCDVALENINPDDIIDPFLNWFKYLEHTRIRLLEIINSIKLHHNYLSDDFLIEIYLIEHNLIKTNVFYGTKTLSNNQFDEGKIIFQEILIHNSILQNIKDKEFKNYKKEFDNIKLEYRKKYYGSTI